jgi:hypothetical protein
MVAAAMTDVSTISLGTDRWYTVQFETREEDTETTDDPDQMKTTVCEQAQVLTLNARCVLLPALLNAKRIEGIEWLLQANPRFLLYALPAGHRCAISGDCHTDSADNAGIPV